MTSEQLESVFRELGLVELNILRVGARWAAMVTLTHAGSRQSFISENQPTISDALDEIVEKARGWSHASMS